MMQVKKNQDIYRSQLLSRRVETPVDEMVRQLLIVALTRYARPVGGVERDSDAEEGAGS